MTALTEAILTEAIEASLRPGVTGPVYTRGDPALVAEVAGFNALLSHQPDVVIGVATEADVVACVRFATEHSLPVHVQATGHGTYDTIENGMLLITRRLDTLVIDPDSRIATIGAGLTWASVMERAAEHALAPVTGSSTGVGAVGFLLGGGLGPLSRTFGFAADWVRSFRVVTADGNAVTTSASENQELFWALRGGKVGLGIVTEARMELIPLSSLYGGGLFFEGENIEPAFRGWVDWSKTVPDAVTSSVALLRLPQMDDVPPPLRGRTLLHVRFAYVGRPDQGAEVSAAEAETILAPLRESASVYLDMISTMPAAAIGQIHHDPAGPLPVWDRGLFLTSIDQDFVSILLEAVGPTNDVPLIMVEVRQLGGAIRLEPDGGGAIGGRRCEYTLMLIGAPVPDLFAQVLPALADSLTAAVEPWRHSEANFNLSGHVGTAEQFSRAWPPPVFERLAAARSTYDPTGMFAFTLAS